MNMAAIENGHLEDLVRRLGKENVITDEPSLKTAAANTLGLERHLRGILYPRSTEQVQQIVLIANKHGLKLHPISSGMNIGYGDLLPISDGHYIVNLKHLKEVLEFSNKFGQIRFQSGFTQGDAIKYLEANGSDWFIDCTGIGPDGSFVGNTLEGGFGISELGNRRANVGNLDIVLGNGTIVNTGVFPGLGPDISGTFIQSNFGIVTGMQMNLVKKPEHFESFVLRVNSEEQLFDVLAALREMRYHKVLPGIGRTSNALRSLVTFEQCPQEYKDQVVTNNDACQILRGVVGLWTVFGAVYGSKDEVCIKKRVVKKQLGSLGELRFFTDSGVHTMRRNLGTLVNVNPSTSGYAARLAGIAYPILRGKTQEDLIEMQKWFNRYSMMHEVSKGIPPPQTPKSIQWKAGKLEDTGLMWYAPVVKGEKDNIKTMLDEAGECFAKYGFDMPVTLNSITPETITGIISIHFDKTESSQVKRAHELYEVLNVGLAQLEIHPYRLGIQGQANQAIVNMEKGRAEALSALKRAWDPNNVIQPGRYGIV